jgi:hypothetical protein
MRASMKLIAAAVLTIAWLGSAVAGTQPIKGGSGGGYFVQMCDTTKGEYVVGFEARAGSWIDRIQILCGFTVTVAGKVKITGASLRGHPAGGMGGGSIDMRCGSIDHAVAAIEFGTNRDQYVNDLRFVCRGLTPPHSAMAQPVVVQIARAEGKGVFDARPYGATGLASRCPQGQLAVGLHGRAGKFVDALGLICGPAPRLMPAPTVQAPAPQPSARTSVPNLRQGPRVLGQ